MNAFLLDLKHAARSLAKSPSFTAIAVLTLALGIGVNTAVFSVADAALFRPLTFARPEELVRIYDTNPTRGYPPLLLVAAEFRRLARAEPDVLRNGGVHRRRRPPSSRATHRRA